jgi:hypothetical protein
MFVSTIRTSLLQNGLNCARKRFCTIDPSAAYATVLSNDREKKLVLILFKILKGCQILLDLKIT